MVMDELLIYVFEFLTSFSARLEKRLSLNAIEDYQVVFLAIAVSIFDSSHWQGEGGSCCYYKKII